jgi:two-component system, LytTR family, response regulator
MNAPTHNPIRALIVDDSPADRESLRRLLSRFQGVEIAGEAATLDDARRQLRAPAIDLLFLDIELGRDNGFSLLAGTARQPHVVITSVHREYAAEAFDVAVLDYLVKPIREERLRRALMRARKALGGDAEPLNLIPIQSFGSTYRLIHLREIAAILADGNFSTVYHAGGIHGAGRSLRDWQALLADLPFIRVDRSTLIHRAHVESIVPHGRGCILPLKGHAQGIELGRAGWERLRERLAIG